MKNSGLRFFLRNLKSKIFTPGYGGCLRCRGRWNVVEHHVTYENDGHGCFPLCETCWTELETPEARLPFYEMLVFERWSEAERWPTIQAAVLAGR
ncbi:MAG: hypothetical protein ACOH18_03695 [Candidatus Saccharimonadaceae bacterium]